MIRTASAEQTRDFGRRIGEQIRPGDLITLTGPFGAGKTTLVQGIGDGLGIRDNINSPSFTLVNEYHTVESGARVPFFHLDLYRIDAPGDVLDLGLDEYVAVGGAIAIEWPGVATTVLPADRLDLRIEMDGDARVFQLDAGGAQSRRLRETLLAWWQADGGRTSSSAC